ncbi:hypothetical protein BKA93DRAFT_750097 [Sparassis latifolia]
MNLRFSCLILLTNASNCETDLHFANVSVERMLHFLKAIHMDRMSAMEKLRFDRRRNIPEPPESYKDRLRQRIGHDEEQLIDGKELEYGVCLEMLDWYQQYCKREGFLPKHLKEAPSRGSRDALGTVSIDLPGVNPQQIMPHSSASQGHLPKNSIRSSTAKDSSENKAANDLLTAGHSETVDEDNLFVALELPIFMMGYMKEIADRVMATHQHRFCSTSAAMFLEAIGKSQFPVFSGLVDGPRVSLAAWSKEEMLLVKKAVNSTNLPTVRVAFG